MALFAMTNITWIKVYTIPQYGIYVCCQSYDKPSSELPWLRVPSRGYTDGYRVRDRQHAIPALARRELMASAFAAPSGPMMRWRNRKVPVDSTRPAKTRVSLSGAVPIRFDNNHGQRSLIAASRSQTKARTKQIVSARISSGMVGPGERRRSTTKTTPSVSDAPRNKRGRTLVQDIAITSFPKYGLLPER